MEDDPRLEETDRVLAALGYVFWPLAPALLISPRRELRFVRYHALQAFFLGASALVLYVLMWLVYWFSQPTSTATITTVYGAIFLLWFLGLIFTGLVVFAIQLFFSYKAWIGATPGFPLIGALARQMAEASDSPEA